MPARWIETDGADDGRLRTILDAMVEAVIVTDARGRVVLVNRALIGLVGRGCSAARRRFDSDPQLE